MQNVGLLFICAYYIVTVYIIIKDCDSKWSSLALIAYVTPMIGALLYVVLKLKREHTEKYAMAHLDAQVAIPAGNNV